MKKYNEYIMEQSDDTQKIDNKTDALSEISPLLTNFRKKIEELENKTKKVLNKMEQETETTDKQSIENEINILDKKIDNMTEEQLNELIKNCNNSNSLIDKENSILVKINDEDAKTSIKKNQHIRELLTKLSEKAQSKLKK